MWSYLFSGLDKMEKALKSEVVEVAKTLFNKRTITLFPALGKMEFRREKLYMSARARSKAVR